MGGLVGAAYTGDISITHSYATGKVTGLGGHYVGGLIGRINSVFPPVTGFWDKTKSTSNNACGFGACANVTAFISSDDAYLKTKAPLSSWDFTSAVPIWQEVSCNYPNLKNVGGTQNPDKTGTC